MHSNSRWHVVAQLARNGELSVKSQVLSSSFLFYPTFDTNILSSSIACNFTEGNKKVVVITYEVIHSSHYFTNGLTKDFNFSPVDVDQNYL